MAKLIFDGRRYVPLKLPGDRRGRPATYDAPLARLVLFATLVMGRDAERTLFAAARLLQSRREATGSSLGWDSAIRRVREIESTERKLHGNDPAGYAPPDPARGISILESIAEQHGYARARHVLVMALADRMAGTCDEPRVWWECVLAAQLMVTSAEHGLQRNGEIAARIERIRIMHTVTLP